MLTLPTASSKRAPAAKRAATSAKSAAKATAKPRTALKKTQVAAAPVAQQSPDESEESQYFSRAVSKAFYILNFLNLSQEPVALNEMASRAGLTKTSCFRLLHTLERLRYIAQGPDSRYSIAESNWGSPSTQIANALLRSSQPIARALSEACGESVSIAVLFTNHIEVVQSFESSRVLRMANTVGRILPPHASSLGKAIAAFQPEAVRRKLLVSYGLQRFTPNTITDESKLREEFKKIRKQQYAYEGEESTWDGCCFGAPIFIGYAGEHDAAVAAISVSMPKSRKPAEGFFHEIFMEQLFLASGKLSKELRIALLERM